MHQIFQVGKFIELSSVDSTNNYAAKLLKEASQPDGTVILSHYQTSGRGQRGATWKSDRDQNLTFSLILHPSTLNIEHQFLLNKTISLGICDFLAPDVDGVSVKWPNDILVGNSKIAGILIENAITGSKIDHSIIGVGLNLNQETFEFPRALSMYNLLGRKFDVRQTCILVANAILARYSQLVTAGNQEIDGEYLDSLFGLNQPRSFNYKGTAITGTIRGVDHWGKLLVEADHGDMIACDLKEIGFNY